MQLYQIAVATFVPLAVAANAGAVVSSSTAEPKAWIYPMRSLPAKEVKEVGNKLAITIVDMPRFDETDVRIRAPEHRESAITGLERLRVFAKWPANWDGDGAPAPDRGALDAAGVLLGLLSTETGRSLTVSLNGEGEPLFTSFDEDFELGVTVKRDQDVGYYIACGGSEAAGLVAFDGRALPNEIRESLASLRVA